MMIKMDGIAQVMDSRLTVTWDSPSTYTHFSLRIGLIILTIMSSTMRSLSCGCGDEWWWCEWWWWWNHGGDDDKTRLKQRWKTSDRLLWTKKSNETKRIKNSPDRCESTCTTVHSVELDKNSSLTYFDSTLSSRFDLDINPYDDD